MLRILHLLPASPDYQTEIAVAQLRRPYPGEIICEIRTVGHGGDYATAARGIIALRRHRDDADLIHAWGEAALLVGAMGSNRPIIFSPIEFPHRRAIRWLRSIMNYRDIQVICPTDTMRREFVEHGVPIERCHLIRPGVDFSRINRRRDRALRSTLGFGDDDLVLLAVGESTRSANHQLAAWAAVVLHVLDRRNRLLLWGRGPLAQKTARFVHRLEQPDLCSVAAERLGTSITFEELLPASDLALVTASGPAATLPIAICMAAALPIVAVVSSTVSELLEDRHNAMLVGRASSRAIARRVLDVREDPSLQWTICDTARTQAYEYFSQTRFTQQVHSVYQQINSAQSVSVPQQVPGAGARFHATT